jgi:hypothetical protein
MFFALVDCLMLHETVSLLESMENAGNALNVRSKKTDSVASLEIAYSRLNCQIMQNVNCCKR